MNVATIDAMNNLASFAAPGVGVLSTLYGILPSLKLMVQCMMSMHSNDLAQEVHQEILLIVA